MSKAITPANILLNYNQLFKIPLISKLVSKSAGKSIGKSLVIYLYENPRIYKYADRRASHCKTTYFKTCIAQYIKCVKSCKIIIKHIASIIDLPTANYYYFDFLDHEVADEVENKVSLRCTFTQLDSPSFLLSSEQRKSYAAHGPPFTFNTFYNHARAELNCFPNAKNYDKDNRSSLKNTSIKIPELYEIHFPTDYAGAAKWLNNFVKHRLPSFGDYQDAVTDKNLLLSHAGISPMLNMGLLLPADVINKIPTSWKTHAASYEGFLRQLFWREYMAVIYVANIKVKNIFRSNKRIPDGWYEAKNRNGNESSKANNKAVYITKIPLINQKILQAIQYGYLHHIERLMLIGNYILLNSYSPEECYNWFMANFVDAHHWVMVGNVYHMLMWSTGRIMSHKPYIASATYLNKMVIGMSDADLAEWDKFYKKFILKNANILQHTYMISGHLKRARSL